MPDDTYTTLLNFVSDSGQANRDIKDTTKNLKEMEKQAAQVSKVGEQLGNVSFPGDELSKDFELFTNAFNKSFKVVDNKMKELRDGSQATTGELRKFANSSVEELRKVVSGVDLAQVDANKIRENAKRLGENLSKGLEEGLRTGQLTQEDLFEIEGIQRGVEELKGLEEAHKKEVQAAVLAHRQKAILYTREASILQKQTADVRQNAEILKNQAQQLQGISQLGLGLGVGIVGGIFAGAQKYVKDVKVATDVTRQWEAAQRSLANSGERVGARLAETALPLLQKAAELAERASRFIDQNPEIVRAALNVGIVTAGLGALGVAVSKGIKFYADQQILASIPLQLQAGNLQLAAAHEQLLAARLKAGLNVEGLPGGGDVNTGLPKTPGLGNINRTLATVALYATSVIIGSQLGTALGNKIGEAITKGRTGRAGPGGYNVQDALLGTAMLTQTPGFLLVKGLNAIGLVSDQTVDKMKNNLTALDKFAAGLIGANKILTLLNSNNASAARGERGGRAPTVDSGTTRVSTETLQQALKIYEDYKADDLELVSQHYADRSKIVSEALAAEATENKRYASNVSKVNQNTAKALADARKSFDEANVKAEQNYQLNRSQIIKDGFKDVEQAQKQSQERLRKLAQEHSERVAELTAARDALGLVKENRRYAQGVSEEKRQLSQEIRDRREAIAQRLADLKQSYLQEQADRAEEYKNRVAEIRANAAEQLKELAQQHQEELQQIREQKVARLRELDNQFIEERKRRYNQFLQNLRDLDAGLLGEKKLRQQYQAAMLTDLETFLNTYKNKLATLGSGGTGGTTGTLHAAGGGYATYGTYLLGDAPGGGRGKTEYVMGGDLTALAERVLGGRITQEKMAALLATLGGGGGSGNNITYNDSRRINSRVSGADRELMRNDMVSALGQIFR